MAGQKPQMPELIPQLSPGSHRSPRKGACFMELASYLAGERWSDHPACTHPLLGALARLVNDHTTDAGRGRLVGLVPSVIGLTSVDPRLDAELALWSAITALPVASAEDQRVLAVAVLTAEQTMAELDGRPAGTVQESSRQALARVPHAAAWAQHFRQQTAAVPKNFHRRGAPNVVRHAVIAIARACVPDPDALLHDLLAGAIAHFPEWNGRDPGRVAAATDETDTQALHREASVADPLPCHRRHAPDIPLRVPSAAHSPGSTRAG